MSVKGGTLAREPTIRVSLETVKQGIKQIYPPDDPPSKSDKKPEVSTNIDIVFVPGLGANPEESWKSTKTDFNWASSSKGLAKDYPNARILLYLYESAFHGTLKVDQFMDNIAAGLLHALQSKREDQFNRPIVFIGHSMGGLVIAKAVTLMDIRRDQFRKMFEATAGCIFFGSPFNGAEAANVAAMFSFVGEKFGQATTSKLLELMKPGESALRELRGDFMRLVVKLSPKIELYCFWENHDTDIAKMAADFIKKREPSAVSGRISSAFYDLFKKAQGAQIKIVDRESATFGDTVDNLGLACNHRDLVKFDDFKDERYQTIRDPLKRIIHGASLVAKNRLNSTRDVDLVALKNITDVLQGLPAPTRLKSLKQKFTSSSWLPTEKEFLDWLGKGPSSKSAHDGDCLWICGAEGRGKTGATIAAIAEIEKVIEADRKEDTGKPPVLLVYYFCDPSQDFSSAEELLKSLIWQLIQKQPLFVPYAKQFTERPSAKQSGDRGKRKPVPASVENLWQSLQDMLSDETASSKIYFVINNLHALTEESDSTKKLLEYIGEDLKTMNDTETVRTSTRWLLTSRKAKRNVDANLKDSNARQIDLEDSRYTDQVQLELRKHAQKKVATLGAGKEYRKDLEYFVSSLVGNRAQSTGWIDLTCNQLAELPKEEAALRVRQVLKKLPQDLDDLLDEGWEKIFKDHPKEADGIKEVLQALVLTYEDPTLVELAVLAGFPSDENGVEEIRQLITSCAAFLTLKGKTEERVCFKNAIMKPHLLRHATKLLGVSEEEMKWLHGELALRSFLHLMETFDVPEVKKEGEEEENNENEDENNDDDDDDDDDDDEEDEEKTKPDILALPYMVQHWLHHASKATVEMAEDLSREERFWQKKSRIRTRWLEQYEYITDAFDQLEISDPSSLTGLQVASSLGYRQLVTALIDNGYSNELNLKDDDTSYTPLHFAAFFGRPNIVEELIYKSAEIEGAKADDDVTPLSMASKKGNIKVMKMLLDAGADPNAVNDESEACLNRAVDSGNIDAVKLLIERGAIVPTTEEDPWTSSLSNAAMLPDTAMFDHLMEVAGSELTPVDYDSALSGAAYAGNVTVFTKLLDYDQYLEDSFQDALDAAVSEGEDAIIDIILEKFPSLDAKELFLTTAASTDASDERLQKIWDYANGSIPEDEINDALYQATDNEKESTVKFLLETCHADPNATGEEYGNALTAAAYDGTIEVVKMLLDAGADANSSEGWAIQTAAEEGHEDVVKELLERGADINSLTTNDYFDKGTALQAAVEAGKVDMVKLLLENGADPNLGAGELTCPIIAATTKSEGEILEELCKYQVDVDVLGGEDNTTPLNLAAANMPQESIKVLIDAGADPNRPDPEGDTALAIACAASDSDSAKFLLENGADVMATFKSGGLNALHAALRSEDEDCLKLIIDAVGEVLTPGGLTKKSTGEVDDDDEEDDDDDDDENKDQDEDEDGDKSGEEDD